MPRGLRRIHGGGNLHFITTSCYQREPLLGGASARNIFLGIFEQVRKRYEFEVMGFVVMPEHIHVLISEPKRNTVPKVVQVLKQRVARRLLRKRQPSAQRELWERSRRRFWQRRYYDFNVYSDRKVTEKLRYMHRNPVQRGLVAAPELWALEQLPSIRSLRGRNSEAELAAAFR
jgi:putative transposase